MRTGEKAGRTAAKRRTEVRRLCVRTILQGDEAQRNNPVIRPSYKEHTPWRVFFITSETTVELLVTRNSLLVTDQPAPTTHANYVCCGVVGIGMFPSRD